MRGSQHPRGLVLQPCPDQPWPPPLSLPHCPGRCPRGEAVVVTLLARLASGPRTAAAVLHAREAQVGGLQRLQVFASQLEPQLGRSVGRRCEAVSARGPGRHPEPLQAGLGAPEACGPLSSAWGGGEDVARSIRTCQTTLPARQARDVLETSRHGLRHSAVNGTSALNSPHKDG